MAKENSWANVSRGMARFGHLLLLSGALIAVVAFLAQELSALGVSTKNKNGGSDG